MWLEFSAMRELSVAALDGEAGKLVDLLIDDQTWSVRFFVVKAGGWFFQRTFVLELETLASIDFDEGTLSLQLSLEELEKSERLHDVPPVSLQREQRQSRALGWVPVWPVAKMGANEKSTAVGVPRPPLGDPNLRSLAELIGYQLTPRDGGGKRVDDFLIESGYLAIKYLVCRLGNWLSSDRTLIATSWISGVSWSEKRIDTDLDAGAIDSSPHFDSLVGFDRDVEMALYEHHQRVFEEPS